MKVLGLSGKKGTGKTTIAKIVARAYDKTHPDAPALVLGFGDEVKSEVATLLGVQRSLIEMEKTHYRPLLQWWATEHRRRFDPIYWIKYVQRAIDASHTGLVIIHDVRFMNEYQYIKDLGGIMWRVVRKDTMWDGHSSETTLDCIETWDRIIMNDKTYDDLINEVEEIYGLTEYLNK